MLLDKFPAPARIGYIPSPYEPDEDGVQDLGYCQGRLSDGRSYRLECWCMDELLMVTVMFSDFGLGAYKREDMALLLENEHILSFTGAKHSIQCNRAPDDAGQSMWMLNVMLQNGGQVRGRLTVALSRYR